MSGLAGVVNLDGAPVDRQLVRQMAQAMRFRGPDGITISCDGPAGLCHALLRTGTGPRTEAGLANLDHRLFIVADARLDGRDAIEARLSRELGASIRAASDAELILRLYAARGESGLDELLGDFAFAIWDAGSQRLLCARDHFGVKPFFYARVGDTLVFANTLPCVLLHPRIGDEIDEGVVADFLVGGENPQLDATFFREVRRLPPAHRLCASRDSFRIERSWSLPAVDDVRYRRGREYVEHFTELFEQAVSDRLPMRRAGLLMSGGLDSPSVAAMAREVMQKRGAEDGLFACTGVYERLIPDREGHYAGLVAEHLGIPIHYFPADDYELFGTLDRASVTPAQPGIESIEYGEDVHDFAAERVRVMLTGQGGDPALRYDPFYLTHLLFSGRVLRVARESLAHLVRFGRPPWTGARTFWRRHVRPRDPLADYPDWLNPEFAARYDIRERWRAYYGPPNAADSPHPTRPEIHTTLQASGWTHYFEGLDPGVSRVTLEVRHPFFDVRLLRFLLGIPAIPWCVNKEILRRAMRKRLPEAVRKRPKTPLAGEPVHAFPEARFGMLAHRLRTAPDLARFVQVDALVGLLSARESLDPTQLQASLSAISLAEWLRSGRGVQAAGVSATRRIGSNKERIHDRAQV